MYRTTYWDCGDARTAMVLKKALKESKSNWYQNNKSAILEKNKENYQKNKEKILEKNKLYRQKNIVKVNTQKKIYRENNKEKISISNKKYRENNKLELEIYFKNHYKENKESVKKRVKRWKKENKDKVALYSRKRRERESNLDMDYSLLEFNITLGIFNYCCFNCNTKENLTIDHNYPLSKGYGLNIYNAVVLCKICNSSKGIKFPDEFYTNEKFNKLVDILNKIKR